MFKHDEEKKDTIFINNEDPIVNKYAAKYSPDSPDDSNNILENFENNEESSSRECISFKELYHSARNNMSGLQEELQNMKQKIEDKNANCQEKSNANFILEIKLKKLKEKLIHCRTEQENQYRIKLSELIKSNNADIDRIIDYNKILETENNTIANKIQEYASILEKVQKALDCFAPEKKMIEGNLNMSELIQSDICDPEKTDEYKLLAVKNTRENLDNKAKIMRKMNYYVDENDQKMLATVAQTTYNGFVRRALNCIIGENYLVYCTAAGPTERKMRPKIPDSIVWAIHDFYDSIVTDPDKMSSRYNFHDVTNKFISKLCLEKEIDYNKEPNEEENKSTIEKFYAIEINVQRNC